MTYQVDDRNSLNLGISKRVNRPNFHHTNALQLVNPLFDWIYNPNIIPETSHNIDLNFRQINERWSLGLTAHYRLQKDVILWVADSKSNRQVFQYKNAGNFHSAGFELDAKYKTTDSWDVALSGNYFYHRINKDIDVSYRTNHSSRIQLKNTWKLNKHVIADAVYIVTPERQSAFSITQPRKRLDLSLNSLLDSKRLSISLRVVDVFNQNIIDRQTITSALVQETTWDFQNQTRNFLVHLAYQLFDKKVQQRNEKERKYNKPLID